MSDVHSKEIRSKNTCPVFFPVFFGMAAIKGKNTKPEMLVRKFLYAKGSRYKLHNKSLPANRILPARPQTGFTKIQNRNLRAWLLLAWT